MTTPEQRAEAALRDACKKVRNGWLPQYRDTVDLLWRGGVMPKENFDLLDVIAHLLAAQGKVKPLEWKDHEDKEPIVLSRADTLLGTYFICDDTDDFTGLYLELISHDDARWWQHVRSTSETIMENYHGDDLSPLKAAAKADYELRILSTLEAAS